MHPNQIEGVGAAKAEVLTSRDRPQYSTAEEVAHANLSVITQMEGISSEVVMRAQDLVGVDGKVLSDKKIRYTCQHCGEATTKDKLTLENHENSCDRNPDRPARYR